MGKSSENDSNETSTFENEQQRYYVLVEFAYKHLDFHMAELESVLDMNHIQLGSSQCRIEQLPSSSSSSPSLVNNEKANTTNTSSSSSEDKDDKTKSQQRQQHKRRRRPFVILSFPFKDAMKRLKSSSSSSSSSSSTSTVETTSKNDRWMTFRSSTKNCDKKEIGDIISRCTLVKSVVELWGSGSTLEKCSESASKFVTDSKLGKYVFEREACDTSKSWKMTIATFGTKFTREHQQLIRGKFSYLGFKGPVQMDSPTNEYVVIREVEMNDKGCPTIENTTIKKISDEERNNNETTTTSENNISLDDYHPPFAVYFGRVLCGSRGKKGVRDGLDQYNLRRRAYLGPTSMDAELSFVMTNLGQVQKSTIAYDPFVGTGSILLSCALRGAYCIGSDIDIRVLQGKSKTQNIWTNFDQYNLQRPEITRTDNAIYHRHYRNHKPLYDAIICDPPYGIRAGARKTGSRLDQPRPILDEHRHDHIPQTKPYAVSDVMSDLLDVAARTLAIGGRLVYVIPSYAKDFDIEVDLPRHDCLQLVHCCYQPLSLELGRRIVAMKKTQEYDPSKRSEYLRSVWVNGEASADKCANIRQKISENARQKPGYEEKAAYRREKRRATKMAKKQAKRLKRKAETEGEAST